MRAKRNASQDPKRRAKVRSILNLNLVMKVGFMALALCLAASQGKAQGTYTGKFTLPFEARWGVAVLQPGDYTITLDLDVASTFNYLLVRGDDKTAIIVSAFADHREISKHSQ